MANQHKTEPRSQNTNLHLPLDAFSQKNVNTAIHCRPPYPDLSLKLK